MGDSDPSPRAEWETARKPVDRSRLTGSCCTGTRAKMYRAAAFAVLLVVSCLCAANLSTSSDTEHKSNDDENGDDCSLWTADKKAIYMPIPFTTNGKNHSIIYANDKGRLPVKHGKSFKLSCAASEFESAELRNVSEVQVSCAGGNRLKHRGKTFNYEDFKCKATPKSELRVTDETCQPEKYTVAEVGFQTEYAFLVLYTVCFDRSAKNSVYTWYVARSPYYNNHQKTDRRPSFVRSRELYGNTDVNKKYTVAQQRKTVATILKSDELAEKYIKNDSKHSLSRGHYAAKADFFFGYEQSATFYYANVAPQWQIFNGNLWADLEEDTRHKLDNDTASGGGEWLIVTGTYGSCALQDADGKRQPLFLDPPSGIPVPLFYWKMVYDARAKDGVVYVGLNDPYREIDDSLYLCPNTCPGGYRDEDGNGNGGGGAGEDADSGLIYCCTKESFERFYGELDPIVYRQL